MNDPRVFKRIEVDPDRRPGWVVDLSPGNVVNPDCYWYFPTRKAARAFLALVDDGLDPRRAAEVVRVSVSGTPPDTSIYLGPERRAWLKAQGGIQPTIHRLVDQAMASPKGDTMVIRIVPNDDIPQTKIGDLVDRITGLFDELDITAVIFVEPAGQAESEPEDEQAS